jgi:DNA-damage-inducible protein D
MASDIEKAPLYRHTMQRLEEVKRVNSQGDDFWVAREIHTILGYLTWDKFVPVINRAESAISAAGGEPSHHIAHTSKMVELGDGAKRRVKEFFLSRGACYLIAMNGDPTKPEIAGAQEYFAIQARRQELLENEEQDRKRLHLRDKVTEAVKRVGAAAKDAGVERYGLFHNARVQGLYGMSTKEVKRKKGLDEGANLFDRAPALELSAHEFQMQLAATKIIDQQINGEQNAINTNLEVAQGVRSTMLKQGVKLENLPLEREPISSVRKRLTGKKGQLPKV